MSGDTKLNPSSLYEGLRNHFGINNPQKYLCKTSLLTGETRIDILKFDEYLHKVHGDYEYENLNMSMLIEQEYGGEAHSFVARYL